MARSRNYSNTTIAVEVAEFRTTSELRPLLNREVSSISIMGTVRLTENSIDGELVYVPTPTADPRGIPPSLESEQK